MSKQKFRCMTENEILLKLAHIIAIRKENSKWQPVSTLSLKKYSELIKNPELFEYVMEADGCIGLPKKFQVSIYGK